MLVFSLEPIGCRTDRRAIYALRDVDTRSLEVAENGEGPIDRKAFEDAVRDAIDALPGQFLHALENVAIVVKDEPDPEHLVRMRIEPGGGELFGLYHGVPLSERGSGYVGLPDCIEIYRGPILRSFGARDAIVIEIRNTVIHELGHHMGLSDDEMPY